MKPKKARLSDLIDTSNCVFSLTGTSSCVSSSSFVGLGENNGKHIIDTSPELVGEKLDDKGVPTTEEVVVEWDGTINRLSFVSRVFDSVELPGIEEL